MLCVSPVWALRRGPSSLPGGEQTPPHPPSLSLSLSLCPHRLYGDQRELEFWSVAQYYLLREKCRLADPRYQVLTSVLYTHLSVLPPSLPLSLSPSLPLSLKVYKQAGPSQPVSDIIRPNSSASVSVTPSPVGPPGGKRVEDIFGPLGDGSGGGSTLSIDTSVTFFLFSLFHPLFWFAVDILSPLSPITPGSLFPTSTSTPPSPSLPSTLSQREVAAMLRDTQLRTLSQTPPLDLCHDLFTDANTYQVYE